MQRNRMLAGLGVIAFTLACSVLALACGTGKGAGGNRTVSFAADQVVITRGGRRTISRCRFTPEKLRMEMHLQQGGGHTIVTIGRQDLGKAWVLFPAMHRYQEVSLAELGDGRVFLKPSPEEIVERLGFETVQGYRCEKMRVRRRGEGNNGPVESTVTVWMADGFPVPLRTVTPKGTVTEYHNIAVGPQPDELFELPAGYTKMAGGFPFGGGR